MTTEQRNDSKTQQNDTPASSIPDTDVSEGKVIGTPGEGPETRPASLETLEQQLANVKEQLLRKAADFENYKRRAESDIQGIIRLANENLVLAILPVVDDLERSLKAAKTADDVASLHKGVELIYQKLRKTLESHGVTPLETAGKPFDVHFHDALMQIPKQDVEPNTILQEVEKGYAMNGKVIRHAKVIVSTAPAEGADPDTTTDAEDTSA